MPTTATGSVVATMAPSSRQAIRPTSREGRQGEADHQRADDDGDDGQQQDRRDVVHQAADVDHQRGLEQQGRQEDVEQGLRRDLEAAQGDDEIAEQAGHRQVLAEEHHDPERAAGQRQQHRERQIQPIGDRRQQADQRQQAGNAENRDGDFRHGGGVARAGGGAIIRQSIAGGLRAARKGQRPRGTNVGRVSSVPGVTGSARCVLRQAQDEEISLVPHMPLILSLSKDAQGSCARRCKPRSPPRCRLPP